MLEHVSLDGFVAGPNGEMDWIKVDDEMFDHVGKLTEDADAALYGRVTFQMMESYWPTAADQPGASKHDIDHSNWYNRSLKIVFSRTLKKLSGNTRIVSANVAEEVKKNKKSARKKSAYDW